jgi:hypothetical protein
MLGMSEVEVEETLKGIDTIDTDKVGVSWRY